MASRETVEQAMRSIGYKREHGEHGTGAFSKYDPGSKASVVIQTDGPHIFRAPITWNDTANIFVSFAKRGKSEEFWVRKFRTMRSCFKWLLSTDNTTLNFPLDVTPTAAQMLDDGFKDGSKF